MPDAIFAEPQLAEIYDLFDSPDRPDLAPYLPMVDEFNTRSIIDLGCGIGSLACRLAARGKDVVGIDPAAASLDVAKHKVYADRVRWITGDAAQLHGLHTDLITMTGNVVQVFSTEEDWMTTLHACQEALNPDGRLVFEVRDPAREAWKSWHREQSYQTIEAPGVGTVESWTELVSSESTLRYRTRSEITDALSHAGLTVKSVRDAPDRSGLEFVFVAYRSHP